MCGSFNETLTQKNKILPTECVFRLQFFEMMLLRETIRYCMLNLFFEWKILPSSCQELMDVPEKRKVAIPFKSSSHGKQDTPMFTPEEFHSL